MEFQLSYFSPERWCCYSAAFNMLANLENSAVTTGLEKLSSHSNPKERQCQRLFQLLHNCTHLTRQQSNAQILQAMLQQYMNCELPDVQAGFRKGRGIRDQMANIHRIIEKAREFQKNIYFCLLTMPKPLVVWITTNCGKFFKTQEYQATLPDSWEICMQVKSNS